MATGSRLMRWGTYYMLGNPTIDRQHEELIDLLNRLHAEWQEGLPRNTLAVTLGCLVGGILTHFDTEEQFMARHHYARFASHKLEHDSFAAGLTAFQRDFQAGRASFDEPVFHRLADWLRDHLIVSDRPMGAALRRKR